MLIRHFFRSQRAASRGRPPCLLTLSDRLLIIKYRRAFLGAKYSLQLTNGLLSLLGLFFASLWETSMKESVPRSKQDWLLLVGLFCFFFSGAAGLLYQVVWTRMLTQIFGNTTYAIATVLSAFMAGLAGGRFFFLGKNRRAANKIFSSW